MTWQHPYVLAAAPMAIVAAWWLFRTGAPAGGCRFPHIRELWADRRGLRDRAPAVRRRARGLALAVAAVLALVALARPQWGEIPEQSYGRAREVMIALDLSRSMLAEDVSPTRLARAKLLVEALLDQLRGERVGLTVFAGTSFVQSPLSADYEVLREFLDGLDPSYLPQGGTDFGAMLRAAIGGFGEQTDGDRYLVVLSDGEAHDQSWQRMVPALRERDIHVVGLGVGTPEGALVPDVDGGALEDEQGNAVLSKLEPRTLQQLAERSGGTYRDAATWIDIAELVGSSVAQGNKGEYVEERHVRLQDRYQWFLAPAAVLFLLSYWLEFPVFTLARALQTRSRRPHPASAPAIAAVLAGVVAWSTPHQAHAVATGDPPPPSVATIPPPDLPATVAELSEKSALTPADYERLATDTIGFASPPTALRGAPRDGIIDDALAAVDRGEAQDPRAADWPNLRAQLEQLRKPQDPPSADPQQQDKPCDNSGGQEQSPGGGGQSDSQQNAAPGGSGQGDSEQQSGKGPPSDQRNAGGSGGSESADAEHQSPAQRDGQPSHENEGDAADTRNSDGSKSAAGKGDDPGERQAAQAGDRGQNAAADRAGQPQGGDTEQAAPDERAQVGNRSPGEVKRSDEVQPLEAAGLGDEEQPDGSAVAAETKDDTGPEQAQKPALRSVGGGRPHDSAPQGGDPAAAEALARMRRVEDGDAPAVLFERMNRADGEPRSETSKKNW
ncbi:MAG: VWA domain-containing protein [Candidatus Binatia bacterium]